MTALVLGLALTAPSQPLLPGVPPPLPAVPAVPAHTLDQFSRAFAATPGRHQYWLLHPRTGRPVEVWFDLPPVGRLDRFHVGRDEILIDLVRPDFDLRVEFRNDGTVRVRGSR
jgi:hypothetical protein